MLLPDDPFGQFASDDLVSLWDAEPATAQAVAPAPPFTELRERSITAHAAVQFARRVLQDPDVLRWWARFEAPELRAADVPPPLRARLERVRQQMRYLAGLGEFGLSAPSWLDPERQLRGIGFLEVGDDVVFVLVPRRRRDWVARSVIVHNGPDDPQLLRRVRERRSLRYQARAEAQHAPRYDRHRRPYQRRRASTSSLLAEDHA
ncbi:hypothetical protein [Patulibacter defluvii]|uniref:hypothetical protein n=1 Tax=Patulibacter defluvii TaxID=3095358 RepID=UPI002A76335B|nr:hypothetical protein [Patulibacter sp. DM4]